MNSQFEFIERLDEPAMVELTVISGLVEAIRKALVAQLVPTQAKIDEVLSEEEGIEGKTKLVLCGATFAPNRQGVVFNFPGLTDTRKGYEGKPVGFAIPSQQIAHIVVRLEEPLKSQIWFPSR